MFCACGESSLIRIQPNRTAVNMLTSPWPPTHDLNRAPYTELMAVMSVKRTVVLGSQEHSNIIETVYFTILYRRELCLILEGCIQPNTL